MSIRELIALGTGSRVPTRERSHSAYLLLWDGEGILLDPGEGAQRQLAFAGIAANSIHAICLTHFHGDHCLGLPGILQRLSLDQCDHPVHIFYPESGQIYLEPLCNASIHQSKIELILHPVGQHTSGLMELHQTEKYILKAHALDHSAPDIGFRLDEPPKLRFLPEKLNAADLHGPEVGELQRKGWIQRDGKIIRLEDVTAPRPGSVFAFVMDTRPCAGAVLLAKDADLLVMEATYAVRHQNLAALYFHSTAGDAAETALNAGALRLALTHFSPRYRDTAEHLSDAKRIFTNVIALSDLDRVEIPRRQLNLY